ncbi:hypothetical protein [Methanosphaerula subterraneus]|uniref:hypothetical protein n=1 Tax=Methanosphaerula subterraneus TaxID=3350244 RepID=UPI003F870D13
MNKNSDPVPADDEISIGRSGAELTTDMDAVPKKTLLPSKDDFPIVGIGASAGGLEALEQFLKGIPKKAAWPS